MSQQHKTYKSTGTAKPIVLGDVVQLSHGRIGHVKYVGEIAEYTEKGIWYGIDIRMTTGKLGNSNGRIGNSLYFECQNNNGIFLKLKDIIRRVEPSELLTKWVKLTKKNTTMHKLLQSSYSETSKLKKKYNNLKKKREKEKRKYDKLQKKYNIKHNKNNHNHIHKTTITALDDDTSYDVIEGSISDRRPRSSIDIDFSASNHSNHSNDYSVTSFTNSNAKSNKKIINNIDISDDDNYINELEIFDDQSVSIPGAMQQQYQYSNDISIKKASIPSANKLNKSKSVGINQKNNNNNVDHKISNHIKVATPIKLKQFNVGSNKSINNPNPNRQRSSATAPQTQQPAQLLTNSIKKWNTSAVIEWIHKFAEKNNNVYAPEWQNLIFKLIKHKVNGNDLLNMDDTNLLSDQLGINSPQIKYKIMYELGKLFTYDNKPLPKKLKLLNSSSTPTKEIVAIENNKQKQINNAIAKNNKPKRNVKFNGNTTSNNHIDDDVKVTDDKHNNYGSFNELCVFFSKMDSNNVGRITFSGFRFMLIELDPDLEPYKLTNNKIKKCFDEFDITKTNYISIEEFIVVMGKTYLRGLAKLKKKIITTSDIKKYFIQLIKHFMKKIMLNEKNAKYKHKRTRSRSGSKPPPRPPNSIYRKISHARDRSPSLSGSVSRSRGNTYGNDKPPPPPRKKSAQ